MAFQDNIQCVSLPSSGDLSANQYQFVTINASGQVALTADAAAADGVLYGAPAAAGRATDVAIGGIVKVKCGGTVTAGAQVGSGANGLANDAAASDIILGRALEAGTSGSIISILFQPRGAA